jgi:hypothetical protein
MRKLGMLVVTAAVAMMATAAWAAGEAGKDGKEPTSKPGTKVYTSPDGSVTITVKTDANAPTARPGVVRSQVGEAGKEAKEPGLKAEPQPGIRVKTLRVRPGVVAGGEAKTEAYGAPAGGGWAGIHVTPVPAAVAAQLDLKGRGAMVANIAKGSPAEKAGLQQYDVVVADGGKPFENVEALVAGIRAHKPGEQVNLTVVRKGLERQVALTLAAQPPPGAQTDYLYEQDADESWQDQLKLHKGLIRKGPQGWSMELPQGGGTPEKPLTIPLPPELLKVLPNQGYGDFHITLGGTGGLNRSIKATKTTDGTTLDVEGAPDGGIVVRRTAPGGVKTETTLANAEDLRKKDPEAYELYKSVAASKAPRGGFGGYDVLIPKTIVIDGKALNKEAAEKTRQVEKELEKWVKEWGQKAKLEVGEAREEIARAIEPGTHFDFQVAENGAIRVEIREEGNTVKLTFKNEAEMAKNAPKAHEAYLKLLKNSQ